jgi:CheY-like chemotaxis protein
VFEAAGGAEGVEIFRQHQGEIACVLLDLSMPQMDGIAVFHALKALKPDVRVILSSGFSSEQGGVESARLEGLAGFIQKPYTAHHLDEELARVLGPSS